jgi:DnaJ-class molecular chaperone
MMGERPRNKCIVSGRPAGHPMACNDCDPCLFGATPEHWCKRCDGDGWVFVAVTDNVGEVCPSCHGDGFAKRDGAHG